MSDFRFNEAQLLKAGLPRAFVETLRDLARTVGGGLSVTDLNEAESLLLTNNAGRSAEANLASQVAVLEMQLALVRRELPALLSLRAEIEALRLVRRSNVSPLEQRVADLEAIVYGGP